MRRTAGDGARPLRVLQSFTPGPGTNPYLSQLFRAVPGVAQEPFSWRTALIGRYDVLHVHLVDVVFLRDTWWKSCVAGILFGLVLLRVRFGRVALVRTVHNVEPHERRAAPARLLERLCDRWTTLRILLNPHTPVGPGQTAVVIPHGDYSDWFADIPRSEPVEGRVVFFGLLRRYKGVERLIECFEQLPSADASLRIVGRPDASGVGESVRAAVQADARISALLSYVDDATLADEIGRACLVALPYREMHNSGAALLALSLDRPVLVPDTALNRDLAAEFGRGWVLTYEGELTPESLGAAIARAGAPSTAPPRVSAREWAQVGQAHAAAYRSAVASARGHARAYSE